MKNAEIENVTETLLEALNEDQSLKIQEEKKNIITQYHQDDYIVDLEINDWLTVNSWGNTPGIETVIPVNFGDL